MRNLCFAIFLLSVSILFQACEYQEFEPVVLDDTDTISYSEIIQPMFEASCLGSGCHVSAGGVPPTLEADFAYLSLIGGNYVDTLNAEESTLYLRIEKDMPPSSALSDLQIEQVLLWIKQGAKEN